MNKQELLLQSGIVAVVRKTDPKKALLVIDALIKGGITAIEVTLDSENALEIIKEASKKYRDDVIVGAGTVLNSHAAYSAIEHGAEFIFAPTLDIETIKVTKQHGKIVIPGVFTPTEILTAYTHGADIVKIFPGSVVGPNFIKDVRGPLNYIPMMPTGGITLENLGAFIKAGAVAVGVGGSLLNKKLIENEDYAALTSLATAFVNEVQNNRS